MVILTALVTAPHKAKGTYKVNTHHRDFRVTAQQYCETLTEAVI